MDRSTLCVRRLFLLISVVLMATYACAQSTRTWVSGVGDDANPCSRTAPCKTFAGAISKTAADGEIDVLDPGGFGALTITKALTIDGGGGQVASVLVSGTNGIVVQAGPTDAVTIRNVAINGIGSGLSGIKFLSGGALHIEHCSISNFTLSGIDIEPTGGGHVFISDTTSRDNFYSGVFSKATGATVSVSVTNSALDNNYFGLLADDFSQVTVRGTEASGNSYGGFLAQANSGTAILNLVNSTTANNLVGIQVGGGSAPSTIRITGVSVLDNSAFGIAVYPLGTVSSFGNNYNSGNGSPGSSISPQ